MLTLSLSRPLPALLLCALSGCGYVGEPLPPLLNIPQPVADLSALERGATIIARFTLPKLTTEGRGIHGELHWELRAGTQGEGPFHTEEWAQHAKSLGQAPAENGVVEYRFPATPWIGKDVVLAARVRGASGRFSGWSNPLTVTVMQPLTRPTDIKATNVPEGVRLTWHGAGPGYRILRRAEGDPDFTVVGNSEAPQFIDTNTEYGKSYRYLVEAIAKTGTFDVHSEFAPELDFTPSDVFPPAAPTGLTAVPTTSTIELTWDRNTEADVAGYRIYRGDAGGALEKIGEATEGPSYSDSKVESGKTYRYAVTAFDSANNESKPSAEITVTAP